MPLTGTQKVTVAEIAYEEYETIDSLASSLNADQESAVIAYITIWNERKNKVHIRLEGGRDGVSLVNDRLLEAITVRVRIMFGLSPLPPHLRPVGGVFAGGISQADIDTRNADTDRSRSVFSTDLHSWGNG